MDKPLTAQQIAELLSYPQHRRVVQMVREGRFPKPIDDTIYTGLWRWSASVVEDYIAGRWTPVAKGRPYLKPLAS